MKNDEFGNVFELDGMELDWNHPAFIYFFMSCL